MKMPRFLWFFKDSDEKDRSIEAKEERLRQIERQTASMKRRTNVAIDSRRVDE